MIASFPVLRTMMTAIVACCLCGAAAVASPTGADRYVVRLSPNLGIQPQSGRVIIFVLTEHGRGWTRTRPVDGPWLRKPQPIISMAVDAFGPGDEIVFDETAISYPNRLDQLEGPIRVQAILDSDQTERSHAGGPGNLTSRIVSLTVSASAADTIELVLDSVVSRPPAQSDSNTVRWFKVRSDRLSKFYGRDVFHQAGVVLPLDYLDPAAPNRRWPAIYLIPGFGGRPINSVRDYAYLMSRPASRDVAPQAVYVILDPESPLGHHTFADSQNNGPRGTALVEEFIPHLESALRLIPRAEARVLQGHSSGGWTAVWLALRYPEVFGACWASAPDPLDFSAFQAIDVYRDANAFTDAEGRPVPSLRRHLDDDDERILLTMSQEAMMERAIDPSGRSGQQWDSWESVFSPRDPATGLPRPLFDEHGVIDKAVVEHWRRFDIAHLVRSDWARYGPLLTERVRIVCGTLDSFYLNRAAERFAALVATRRGDASGDGYIQMIDGATHGNVLDHVFARWNEEMRAYLRPLHIAEQAVTPPPAP